MRDSILIVSILIATIGCVSCNENYTNSAVGKSIQRENSDTNTPRVCNSSGTGSVSI